MIPVAFGPASRGAAEQGVATQQETRQDATAPVPGASTTTETINKSLIAEPVMPPSGASEASEVSEKRLQTELVVPQPPTSDDDPSVPRAEPEEPAGPLKTYAQIPTEMMQEITRLREEAAEGNAQGVPGRNDPTPMPASPDAIGPTRMPYDAA